MAPNPVPRLVVVGSINVDLTARVEHLPAPGETVGGGALSQLTGGKGANQAVAAARLGARVRMIGAIGDDENGLWARRQLAEAGVDVAGVRTVDAATGVALIGVDAHGENQIIVCPGANAHIDLSGARLDDEEAVITQLELPMATVLAVAAAHGGYLAVNASPAQDLPPELVARTDLFIVNEQEYERMPQLRDARRVAVTYAADGAALFEGGVEVARAAGVPARVVSTVGAGDAFCAALVLALRQGVAEPDALTAACAVGADAVSQAASQPMLRPLSAYRGEESAR